MKWLRRKKERRNRNLHVRGNRRLGLYLWNFRSNDGIGTTAWAFINKTSVSIHVALDALAEIDAWLHGFRDRYGAVNFYALSSARRQLEKAIHRAYCNRHEDCKAHMELARACAANRGWRV